MSSYYAGVFWFSLYKGPQEQLDSLLFTNFKYLSFKKVNSPFNNEHPIQNKKLKSNFGVEELSVSLPRFRNEQWKIIEGNFAVLSILGEAEKAYPTILPILKLIKILHCKKK